jgi:hypothetical protein
MLTIAILVIIIIIIFYYLKPKIEKAEDKPAEKTEEKKTAAEVQDEMDISILASLPKDQLDFLLKYGSPADLIRASRPKKFEEMDYAEKLQYAIDNYFKKRKTEEDTKKDETKKIIQDIPRSDVGCEDEYDECAEWAANGECEVNPEYMLYNCTKSCKVCGVSKKEKSKLIKAYNDLPIQNCVYHGANYPGEGYFLHTFYDYISY